MIRFSNRSCVSVGLRHSSWKVASVRDPKKENRTSKNKDMAHRSRSVLGLSDNRFLNGPTSENTLIDRDAKAGTVRYCRCASAVAKLENWLGRILAEQMVAKAAFRIGDLLHRRD